jgi:metal-responsive CopG/Arc/MetJ family transcriptional regulator
MPNVSLTITLPEDVAQQVQETARSQYLSRSAVLRQIIMKELERLRGAGSQAAAEVPA